MRTSTKWAGLVAAVAVLAPAIAAAGEFSGEKVVPLSRDGIVGVGLEVGPVIFHEVIVHGAPSDPEAIAALPADKKVAPRASVVASHVGQDEVQMSVVVKFEDDDGLSYLQCNRRRIEQDEETTNEANRVCDLLGTNNPTAAQWAKVTKVRLTVSLVESD